MSSRRVTEGRTSHVQKAAASVDESGLEQSWDDLGDVLQAFFTHNS